MERPFDAVWDYLDFEAHATTEDVTRTATFGTGECPLWPFRVAPEDISDAQVDRIAYALSKIVGENEDCDLETMYQCCLNVLGENPALHCQ